MPATPHVLSVRNLSVDARTPEGRRRVLDDINFDLITGETLCIAGESGSGKSVTSLAIMGLLPKASLEVASGNIFLADRDLLRLSDRAMRKVRGGDRHGVPGANDLAQSGHVGRCPAGGGNS